MDTSVALAHLLGEDRRPPDALWDEVLVASRLVEYELWTRLHARRLAQSHGALATALLDRVALVELSPPVLARALEPFPVPVRTLDALHLASLLFLAERQPLVELATYDERMIEAARRMRVPLSAHAVS
ncbi:MAG: PIN domain-containing protein [Deltaproteobacteria bacterium]|nr:PIN domain-containing protein [Deltaproteobacteria bacterium]